MGRPKGVRKGGGESGYTTIRIPEPYHRRIKIVKGWLLMRGIGDLPDWLQEIFTKGKGRGFRDSDMLIAGITIWRLMLTGKTVEQIMRMSKQEVEEILKKQESMGERSEKLDKVREVLRCR